MKKLNKNCFLGVNFVYIGHMTYLPSSCGGGEAPLNYSRGFYFIATEEEGMRTIVYIDGLNLYHSLLEETPYNWLDMKALCEQAIPHVYGQKLNIVGVKYFATKLNDQRIAEAQDTHLQALEKHILGFEYQLGVFRARKKYNFVEGKFTFHRNEEKGTDVNIAVHFLNDAHLGRYDCGVLISNDADLVEPLKLVKERFKEKKLVLLSPVRKKKPVPSRLKEYVHIHHKITNQHLKKSQLPDPIEIGGATIHKPKIWK